MDDSETSVARHYLRAGLLDALLDGLRASGKNPEALTPIDLTPADQFHQGGLDETNALSRLAGFTSAMHVLDVGGGIGGPARMLAEQVGCRVTIVDLSPEYCALGKELTRRTGLTERVGFEHASALAMPFGDRTFDGAWTQHSSMNIADKPGLYREIRRVLRPGARFALHEVVAGPNAPVHFPVPWARGPEISFLAPPESMRATIAAAGFRQLEWHDTTSRTIDWLRRRIAAAGKSSSPPPLGIHLLLGPDAPTMFANLLRNSEEGRQQVVQAVFERV